MPITLVQQGRIAENDFAKFLMIGSGGRIEIAAPLSDDERRDAELHERGRYDYGIAAQFKSVRHLQLKRGARQHRISLRFQVRVSRIVSHPRYWYFIGHLDLERMGLTDPVFVVPSTVLHKLGAVGRVGEFAWFVFSASIGPDSRDKWQPYRVETHQLGRRALDIMSDLRESDRRGRRLTLAPLPSVPDALWLRKAA